MKVSKQGPVPYNNNANFTRPTPPLNPKSDGVTLVGGEMVIKLVKNGNKI